jgi:hypothetical protein
MADRWPALGGNRWRESHRLEEAEFHAIHDEGTVHDCQWVCMEETCGGRSKASGGREGSMHVYGKKPWMAVARLTVKNMVEDTLAVGD